ncbi:hypothetical protein [Burkholderia vietnamiensis]|uniref:Uncharacterized protein n=1 Tax=Burkholderia vietnamiensis TaxID=60552 RepID=A0AAW7T2I7_BURVI|nr:hypothetical protein [Burkholderia vietnamiensis]MBR7912327.1 hypothetical protein [Burkholderia vietnamiensis]MBR8160295.1 hypothetical protein [Burkholderia vietnamiensis]MCA8073291.1 hypothetical protein [Burkholderia vietnamiensis]MCA8146919.1 hypothetical protein [Burkholderia vietnamiensis]MCA8228549.1 hypothetical protein [Burkholderia vietnamiensis]
MQPHFNLEILFKTEILVTALSVPKLKVTPLRARYADAMSAIPGKAAAIMPGFVSIRLPPLFQIVTQSVEIASRALSAAIFRNKIGNLRDIEKHVTIGRHCDRQIDSKQNCPSIFGISALK